MAQAIILSKANVEMESPLICTMGILMDGVQRNAAMIGNVARALWEEIQPQDVVELTGHDSPHKSFLRKENLFLVDSLEILGK